MKTNWKAALCAALGAALLLSLCACGAAAPAPADAAPAPKAAAPTESARTESVPEITVSSAGTVRLTPDKATVSFGVTTEETTAEKAQSKNTEAVNSVIAVLTERGVEDKSIRTSNYSMYPRYDYSGGGRERIIGYTVYTTLSVEDQDIDALGKLLSACVAAGINRVDSVTFLCSGYDEAYREALAQAVKDCRAKAEALAAAAGRTLGDPVTVTEGWQDASARYGRNMEPAAFAMEEAMDAAAPVFQPGETEIRANVTATFAMN